MSKKKDPQVEDLDLETGVTKSDEFDALEAESLEVDLLGDETSVTLRTQPVKEVKPKTSKAAGRRKGKEIVAEAKVPVVNALSSLVTDPNVIQAIEESKIEIPVSTPENVMAIPLTPASGMEAMVKQWSQVRELSQAVGTQLQGVAGTLQELQKHYADALQELSRAVPQKKSPVNRVTVAIAGFAIILSFISLNLSQSARQATITGGTIATSAPFPTKPLIVAANAPSPFIDLPKRREPGPKLGVNTKIAKENRDALMTRLKKEIARTSDAKKTKK